MRFSQAGPALPGKNVGVKFRQKLSLLVQVMNRTLARLMDPVYERMELVLTILFGCSIALMVYQASHLQGNLLESMALANGEMSVKATEFVERVRFQDWRKVLALAASMGVMWVGGLGLVVRKLLRTTEELEQRLVQRTGLVRETSVELQREVAERCRVEGELHRLHEGVEERVRKRTAELEGVNAKLAREVAERKQAEDTIRRLNTVMMERTGQLEASNRELEAFSYSVSHDLRAPLRGIDGFSQAVLEDYKDKLDSTGVGYLQRVREASQRMAKLIDAMLNLTQLTRAELHLGPVDLSQLAHTILAELHGDQSDRHVEWTIAKDLCATGDALLVRVVLENLLANAWKFTSQVAYARIEVGMTHHYAQPVYFVRDNGVGFDMAYAHKLFGPFQRLHALSEFPGIGIGLATVHRIIRRHHGQIWTNAAVGYGATFFFTLEPRGGVP